MQGPPSPVPEGDESISSESTEDVDHDEQIHIDEPQDCYHTTLAVEARMRTVAADTDIHGATYVRNFGASSGKENYLRLQRTNRESIADDQGNDTDYNDNMFHDPALKCVGVQAGLFPALNPIFGEPASAGGLAAAAVTALHANVSIGTTNHDTATVHAKMAKKGSAKRSQSGCGNSSGLPARGTAVFRSNTPRFEKQREAALGPCTGSEDRRPLSEVSVSACHRLYSDGLRRRERQAALQKEKESRDDPSSSLLPLGRRWQPVWATEQRESHEAKRRLREEQRCLLAKQQEHQAMRECTFTPKLVAQSLCELRLARAQRQISRLAQRQQLLLLRFKALEMEPGAIVQQEAAEQSGAGPLPCSDSEPDEGDHLHQELLPRAHPSPSSYLTHNSIIQEIQQLHDEAFGIMAFLASKGVDSIMDDPDPSTLCEDFDTGLARRLALEQAWFSSTKASAEKSRSSLGPLPC
eukprot:TRINITY_DN16023_c0_g1_i1.p1 TRINITY_DN16023_c0_g1~~TRINITY_DN16023_c0_g1_i1.p1  ORF type:complete len:535 (-),score=100.96 TRINITY_DN16023_c0_g1_i1:67-1467(-)